MVLREGAAQPWGSAQASAASRRCPEGRRPLRTIQTHRDKPALHFQVLACHFKGCFKTPLRGHHQPPKGSVPVSCMGCHCSCHTEPTHSKRSQEVRSSTQERLKRLICTRFDWSYPSKQAYFIFITYRTTALALTALFYSALKSPTNLRFGKQI